MTTSSISPPSSYSGAGDATALAETAVAASNATAAVQVKREGSSGSVQSLMTAHMLTVRKLAGSRGGPAGKPRPAEIAAPGAADAVHESSSPRSRPSSLTPASGVTRRPSSNESSEAGDAASLTMSSLVQPQPPVAHSSASQPPPLPGAHFYSPPTLIWDARIGGWVTPVAGYMPYSYAMPPPPQAAASSSSARSSSSNTPHPHDPPPYPQPHYYPPPPGRLQHAIYPPHGMSGASSAHSYPPPPHPNGNAPQPQHQHPHYYPYYYHPQPPPPPPHSSSSSSRSPTESQVPPYTHPGPLPNHTPPFQTFVPVAHPGVQAQRASNSPAPSVSSSCGGGVAKKEKRKYTKKATEYWAETDRKGSERRRSKAAVAASTNVSSSSATVPLATGPADSASKPRPAPESLAGGELDRLRAEWLEREQVNEARRPGWLKRSRKIDRPGKGVEVAVDELEGHGRMLDLWQMMTPQATEAGHVRSTRASGTPNRLPPTFVASPSGNGGQPRPIVPLSPSRTSRVRPAPATPVRIPRTVSAPTLLTSSTGKATVASTQILASELAWLVPRMPPPSPAYPPSTAIGKPTQRSSKADAVDPEVRKKRLAAFEKMSLPSSIETDVFGSPVSGKARSTPRVASSSSSSPATKRLVPTEVIGVGRIAMALRNAQTLVDLGPGAVKVRQSRRRRSNAAQKEQQLSVLSSSKRPNWPDHEYPWAEPEHEKERLRLHEQKVNLDLVARYLEESSDEESEDDHILEHIEGRNLQSLRRRVGITVPLPGLGKSSWGLASNTRRPRVRNAGSLAVLAAKQGDASDARQALILRQHATRTLSMSDLRDASSLGFKLASADDVVEGERSSEEESALVSGKIFIGCLCNEAGEEENDRAMVACDCCMTWHHLDCLGLAEEDLPTDWVCWKCSDGQQGGYLVPDEGAVLRTPHLHHAQPDLASALSDSEDDEPSGPPTQLAAALAPSPMFGSYQGSFLSTPLHQSFGTPRLASASADLGGPIATFPASVTSLGASASLASLPIHSPFFSRSRYSADDGEPIGYGTPGPLLSRSWDTSAMMASAGSLYSSHRLATPNQRSSSSIRSGGGGGGSGVDDLPYPGAFDLSSTPSRHLTREIPFGETPSVSSSGIIGGSLPSSALRSAGVGGSRQTPRAYYGGAPLPPPPSFQTPLRSQNFFMDLRGGGSEASGGGSGTILPALEHHAGNCPSSADSLGPLSPYHPNSRWSKAALVSPLVHEDEGAKGGKQVVAMAGQASSRGDSASSGGESSSRGVSFDGRAKAEERHGLGLGDLGGELTAPTTPRD